MNQLFRQICINLSKLPNRFTRLSGISPLMFLLFPLLLKLGIAAWAAPIVVTVIMLPCTYLLSRAIARN